MKQREATPIAAAAAVPLPIHVHWRETAVLRRHPAAGLPAS